MNGLSDFQVCVGLITENHFPRLGGMEFCNHYLATALNRIRRVRAVVACSALPEVPRNFHYPYTVYRSHSLSILSGYLRRRNIKTMIKLDQPAVLHGSMIHGGGAAALSAGQRFGIPVVVQSHGADVQVVPGIGYGALMDTKLEKLIRYVLAQADRVIAVSFQNRNMLLDLGAPAERIEIVHHGTPFSEIGAIPEVDLRKDYGIPGHAFVLLTVGRNSPIKRMEMLYEALAMVRHHVPGIRCVSVGPIKGLRELADRFGIGDLVILTGPIPDNGHAKTTPPFPKMVNLYRAADLYVSVSRVEAFNVSALDALACGTPILVTQNQGIRDLISEEQTGFVLQDETTEALAGLLQRLSMIAGTLRDRRPEIRNSASEHSWDRAAHRMVSIYHNLLEERGALRRVV